MQPNRHRMRSGRHRFQDRDFELCGCGALQITGYLDNTRLHGPTSPRRDARGRTSFYSVPRFRIINGFLWRHLGRTLDILLPVLIVWAMLAAPAFGAGRTDPLEPVNRVSFQFNSVLDKAILKPAARTYTAVTPRFVRSGVSNFFRNLGEVRNLFNHLLQLDLQAASVDAGRFVINSSIGVGGLFEVAQPALGLYGNPSDFGRTLAHWGVGPGPYLVIPLLGPSTLRDAVNVGIEPGLDPLNRLSQPGQQEVLVGARTVDTRSRLLLFDELIMGDEYLFVREAYLQSRGEPAVLEDSLLVFEDF